MESIKRNIYVLRNAIKEKIEVTKGTDMIPIELKVVDYNIPDYAIAVAYALGQTSDVPKKILCDVGNNAIKFTPSESFFEVGRNELMVRVLKDEKKLFTFCDTVICKDSAIKINDASEPQDPSLVEQLLNKMSDETKDRLVLQSEVEDIRKGYDETIYASAGEAVRGQVEKIKTETASEFTKVRNEALQIDTTLTDAKKAAPADEVGELKKKAYRTIDYDETETDEIMLGKKVYSKSIWQTHLPNATTEKFELNLPSDTYYAWIDMANSYIYKGGYTESFPIGNSDPAWANNTVGVKIINGSLEIRTKEDWAGYGFFATIKYTKK